MSSEKSKFLRLSNYDLFKWKNSTKIRFGFQFIIICSGIVGGGGDVAAGPGPVGVHELARVGEQLVRVGAKVVLV